MEKIVYTMNLRRLFPVVGVIEEAKKYPPLLSKMPIPKKVLNQMLLPYYPGKVIDYRIFKLDGLEQLISEINTQLALFRDMLIHIGTARDSPELREKIRKLRRTCVDACKHISNILLPPIRSAVAEGIPVDHPHLVLVFYMCQLFLRELGKCSRLVQLIPMDMTGYFENRAGPSNLGNVISQILLCKTIAPDFNQEEVCSIAKDSAELTRLLNEMQEFLPTQDISSERPAALISEEGSNRWTKKRRRSSLYKRFGTICCIRRPSYL